MKETDNIQLCEVGDKFYRVCKVYKKQEWYLEEIIIVEVKQSNAGRFSHWYYHDNKGRSYFNHNIESTCFKTKEDAEKEILKRWYNFLGKHEMNAKEIAEELNISPRIV